MRGFFNSQNTKKRKKEVKNRKTQTTVFGCHSCGLYSGDIHPEIIPYGNFKKKILNIGEMPGESDGAGRLWQEKSGQVLKQIYAHLDIDLFDDCYSINAVNCRSKTKPTPKQINCCRQKIIDAIHEYQPDIIILLGPIAVNCVIGGRWKKDLGGIDKWRGWTIPDREFGAWICPTFSPRYILYKQSQEYYTVWQQDFERIFAKINTPIPSFEEETEQVQIRDSIKDIYPIFKDAKSIAFDIEATGLKPYEKGHEIACISFCKQEDEVYTIPAPKSRGEILLLKRLLENEKIKKIGANIKYEDTWMKIIYDITVQGWEWDTMLAMHVIDNRRGICGLKFQVYTQFGVMDYDSEIEPYLKSDKEIEGANAKNRVMELLQAPQKKDKLFTYCGLDSLFTFRLAKIQMHALAEPSIREAYQLLHDGILSLAKAERRGIRIDTEYCNQKQKQLTKKISVLEKRFKDTQLYEIWEKTYGDKINTNSNAQLGTILYDKMEITPLKLTKKSKKGATDLEALSSLNIPELLPLLEIRKIKKIRDTYLQAFVREQSENIIHPFFHLHTVRTYRSSSDSPNFQNIPNREKLAQRICRKALLPLEGHKFIEVDFSGIEVAISCCYHKDPKMIEYQTTPGADMHRDMAMQIFRMSNIDADTYDAHATLRKAAKNGFVFPQFYGDYFLKNALSLCAWTRLPTEGKWKKGQGIILPGEHHISDHMIKAEIKSFEEFLEHMKTVERDFWYNRFSVYRQWKEEWWHNYQENGYFNTLTGFRHSDIMEKNEAVNAPIQGTAFHCLLWSFIQLEAIAEKNNWRSKLVGQVHDDMLWDVAPEEENLVIDTTRYITEQKLKEHWNWINIPLKVKADIYDVDAPWLEE